MSQDVIDIPATPAAEQVGALRELRVLAGWLSPEEAVPTLLSYPGAAPEEAHATAAKHAALRAAVIARGAAALESPIVSGDRTFLDAVASRPEVHAAFSPRPIRIEWVDLTRVIAVQKLVFTDGMDDRVAAAATNESALVELCLPSQPAMSPVTVSQDNDGRGFTFSSTDPNLRLHGAQVVDGAVTFIVGTGSPFLSVASYQGYHYLQNGYHRTAGLLRRGLTVVPAVVVENSAYDFPGGRGAPQFGPEILAAAVPPLLTDYWDETVAAGSFRSYASKNLRVRAEEFMTPR